MRSQPRHILFHTLIAGLLAAGCLAAPATFAQAPLNDAAPQAPTHDQEIDPKILIKAKSAYDLLRQNNPPLLIDVRSRQEFNAEHIQGAISYPYKTIQLTAEYPFAKDRKLMLYCGCPHHLSGMSADILKQRGFKQIHVIDEGYWGWKEQGLPYYRNPNAKPQVSLSVKGQVFQGDAVVAYKNIFIRHPQTEQLEATRTDAQGRFEMHVRFTGVAPKDAVQFQIQDQTLKQVSMNQLDGEHRLEMPERIALR